MSRVAHALRIASTLACGIVILAFVSWAADEGRTGTDAAVAGVSSTAAAVSGAGSTAQPAPEHDGVRGAVEDVNAGLLSPFDHIARDGDPWAAHGIPMLLALLTYGLLARVLIPYLTEGRR